MVDKSDTLLEFPNMGVTIQLLTERAYDSVRRDIVSCALAPGSEISEMELCSRYALGQSGARIALTRLAHEGLVRAIPRRGYRVVPLTLQDLHDVFELRLMLEPAAARMAAGKVNTAALRRCDEVCRAGCEPGDAASVRRLLDANRALHVTIAQASGNARLAAAIACVHEDMTRLLHLAFSVREGRQAAQHDHRALVKVLARGDGEAAERICRDEIEASREMLLSAILTRRSAMSLTITADGA